MNGYGWAMLLFFAAPSLLFADAETSGELTAKRVLAKLYEAAGQFHVKLPEVKISKENQKVAAYYPAKNRIVLDQKALDVCLALGKDSLNALAFILSHELAHSFQTDVRAKKSATNFLSYDHAYHADIRTEKVADIQGVFNAFLAGYSLRKVVPELLPKLYDAYQLTGKTLKGYPTLEERSHTTAEVLKITNTLIDLFENANYLLVAEEYTLAAVNYEHILKYVQGRELHNNLGVICLLQAMELYLPATDRFVHPVELDASSLLTKIKKSRGDEYKPTPQERLERTNLIAKAVSYFSSAVRLDGNYQIAKLNHACALNLLEKPKEALAFLQSNKLLSPKIKNKELGTKARLAEGIAHALLNDLATADARFSQGLKSGFPYLDAMALFNQNALWQRPPFDLRDHCFQFPESFSSLMQSIPMGKTSQLEPLPLDEQGHCLRKLEQGNTSTFSYGDKSGNLVSLIRFRNELAGKPDLLALDGTPDRAFFYNIVSTGGGYFIKSSDINSGNKYVLKLNAKGEIQEMAKVVFHR